MGGGGKGDKKIAQGKKNRKKIRAKPKIQKKKKKIRTRAKKKFIRHVETEKNLCQTNSPHPTHHFSNGQPLGTNTHYPLR